MSHNSSQEEEDSMSYHVTSMFHETLDETKATLYEYLLDDDDDEIESLPELDSCSGSTHSMPRSGFGWTPSPRHRRISNSTTSTSNTSTSTSSLQPYRIQQFQQQQQQQQQDLQEQLELAQKELTEARHANDRLVQNQRVQEQGLSDALRQSQDECRLLKSRLERCNHERQELIQKLRQRDQELEEVQIQLDRQRDLLGRRRYQESCDDCRDVIAREEQDAHQEEDAFVPNNHHEEENEQQLQAQIDECERELQQYGVVLNNSSEDDVPREIHTRLMTGENPFSTTATTPNTMVHYSMGLAQSLIGMFNNNEGDEEDQVMDQLGFMSRLLHGEDNDDDDDDHLVFPNEPLIPFQAYQRLAERCHQLESERSMVIGETLNLMKSVREANILEMEVMEKELKASFQNKVEKCVSDIISSRQYNHDSASTLLATSLD